MQFLQIKLLLPSLLFQTSPVALSLGFLECHVCYNASNILLCMSEKFFNSYIYVIAFAAFRIPLVKYELLENDTYSQMNPHTINFSLISQEVTTVGRSTYLFWHRSLGLGPALEMHKGVNLFTTTPWSCYSYRWT